MVVGARSTLNVLNATSGATILQYTDSGPGTYFYSAATVANGMIYAPNDDGNLYAFGL